MSKKLYLITALSVLTILIIISLFFVFQNPLNSSPSNTELEDCKILSYKNPEAINLVFFASEQETKKYSDFLLTISPFKKEDFNIYYITSYSPNCTLYKDEALFCYSKDSIAKASSCPNDLIIALEQKSREIRSSSFLNFMSLNLAHPETVFPHEFGHAFANLAEEYVPATLPRGAKNCLSACDKFGDIKDGCFDGCSKSEYFRSIDKGIMRTLSSNKYGLFNEELIKERIKEESQKKLNSKVTGKAISENEDCKDQSYQLIEAKYNSETDKIDIIDKSIEQGCLGDDGLDNHDAQLIYTDAPSLDSLEIEGETIVNDKSFFIKADTEAQEFSVIVDGTQHPVSTNTGDLPCEI